jgi:heat shock protein HslJ
MENIMTKVLRSLLICLALTEMILLPACSILLATPNIKEVEWRWQNWQAPRVGRPTQVTNPDRYTLTLNADRTVSVQADCNSGGGEYKLSGNKLLFSQLFSTEMYCGDESIDYIFFDLLRQVQSYTVENGWLVLELADGTLMRFSQ